MQIFISYGHDEHATVALRLKEDFEKQGFAVWLDIEGIKSANDWEVSIERAISSSDWVLVLMTPHSVRRPDGVCLDEVSFARFQNKQIAPVMVHFVQPPLSIARIQWLDMTEWEDPSTHRIREDWYGERLKLLMKVISGEYRLGFEGEQSRLQSILRPLENEADIDRHVKGFVGRQWIFDQFREWLSSDSKSRVLWINGKAGIGKTALAAMLSHKEAAVAGIHFCRHNDSDRADPKKAVCSLAYHLSTQFPEYAEALLALPELNMLDEKNASALFSYLLADPLRHLKAPARRYVLILDGLDEATRDGRNELVNTLAREFDQLPAWLGIVITSRPEPDLLRKLSHLDPFEIDGEDPRNIADINEYLRCWLSENEPEYEHDDVIDALLEKSEGVFLYITEVLKEIKASRLSFNNIESFPTGLRGIYTGFFERQFNDESEYKTYQRPLLELVTASLDPLPVEIAADILKWDDYDRDDALEPLGSLFLFRDDRIEPFHKSLIDWLCDRENSGRFHVSRKKGHERFADWVVDNLSTDDVILDYQMRFGPYHLYTCSRTHDLIELLNETDIRFRTAVAGLIIDEITSVEGTIDQTKVHELLRLLVAEGTQASSSILFKVVERLIDFSLFDAAKSIKELFPSDDQAMLRLGDLIDLEIARMAGQPGKVVEIGKGMLEAETLPNGLARSVHHYLAEGLRESGLHKAAMDHYQLAIQAIDRDENIVEWLNASFALGDMEYVYGLLPEAKGRLQEVLELAHERDIAVLQGRTYRELGQIELVLDNDRIAEELFAKSLSIAVRVRRPYSIIESYNSLAEAQRKTKPDEAILNVEAGRREAEKAGANLEYGKSYYIEAEILLSQAKAEEAEVAARRSQILLSEVGYGSGIARARTLLAEALLNQEAAQEALEIAIESLQYYQREVIYPSLRIKTFDLVMKCAKIVGRSEELLALEEVAKIPNIQNFVNVASLVEAYSSRR